jgi:hypothetical protein
MSACRQGLGCPGTIACCPHSSLSYPQSILECTGVSASEIEIEGKTGVYFGGSTKGSAVLTPEDHIDYRLSISHLQKWEDAVRLHSHENISHGSD